MTRVRAPAGASRTIVSHFLLFCRRYACTEFWRAVRADWGRDERMSKGGQEHDDFSCAQSQLPSEDEPLPGLGNDASGVGQRLRHLEVCWIRAGAIGSMMAMLSGALGSEPRDSHGEQGNEEERQRHITSNSRLDRVAMVSGEVGKARSKIFPTAQAFNIEPGRVP